LSGIDKFKILGIDPSLSLDPANSTAFVTGVTFTGDGAFTGVTAVTAVPETSTWASDRRLLPASVFLTYRRRSKKPTMMADPRSSEFDFKGRLPDGFSFDDLWGRCRNLSHLGIAGAMSAIQSLSAEISGVFAAAAVA
jgi:hypothetical protein